MPKRWGLAFAVLLAWAGATSASAAPISIGTFSLVEGDGIGLFLDVSNTSTSLVFSDLSVSFCDGSVVPADTPPSFLMGDGSVRTCSQLPMIDVARFGDGSVRPGEGVQFVGDFPSFGQGGLAFVARFAFLNMSVQDRSGTPIPFGVDPLDLSCDPRQQDCTNFIYRLDSVPVAEPLTLTLVLTGLGAMAGRRLSRRRRQCGPDA